MTLTSNSRESWLQNLWDALDQHSMSEDRWDDVCTAMAWLKEDILPSEATMHGQLNFDTAETAIAAMRALESNYE